MQTNGYKPILAHPERYPFYYKHFDEYKRIRDSGVLLQINFNSLAGYYGIEAKKIAEQLIDEKMVDLIGSDMHHSRHAHCMRKVCSEKYFYKVAEMNLLNKTLY
jgi:tyrosine-protein phosphatase YwqE